MWREPQLAGATGAGVAEEQHAELSQLADGQPVERRAPPLGRVAAVEPGVLAVVHPVPGREEVEVDRVGRALEATQVLAQEVREHLPRWRGSRAPARVAPERDGELHEHPLRDELAGERLRRRGCLAPSGALRQVLGLGRPGRRADALLVGHQAQRRAPNVALEALQRRATVRDGRAHERAQLTQLGEVERHHASMREGHRRRNRDVRSGLRV